MENHYCSWENPLFLWWIFPLCKRRNQAGYIPIDCLRVTKPSPGGKGSASVARALSSCSSVVERSAPSKAPRFSATCRALGTTGNPLGTPGGAMMARRGKKRIRRGFRMAFRAFGHRIPLNPSKSSMVHGSVARVFSNLIILDHQFAVDV